MTIELRDYQREAIAAIYEWFEKAVGNPLIVIPTGGGKSACIAMFCREVVETWKDQRILVVTHVKELIEQNHDMLIRAWPEAVFHAGIYSAGLGRRDNRARILFAGVQSVYRKAKELGSFDLVLVDEAHLIPRSGNGRYLSLLADLKTFNPAVKMIGFTATPFRLGEGSLHRGDEAMFHGIAYECDMLRLIDAGWLSPVTAKVSKEAVIDTSEVTVRGGEFVETELEEAAMKGDSVERAVHELVMRGKDRRSWLIFACSIRHAETIAGLLRQRHKIPTVEIYGHTPKEERENAVAAIRSGEARAAVNVQVLTTGFDAPGIDLIAFLRPTMSAGLYVQMVGRGMRRAPNKDDCLVLDFSGNVMRHGPVNAVTVKEPGEKVSREAPVKECPECGALVATATVICNSVVGHNEQTNEPIRCTYEFPVTRGKPQHDDRPDDQAEVLRRGSPLQWWKVEKVWFTRHEKEGKPPSLRVDYSCGFGRDRTVSEWVCFEHEGFARKKAVSWWLGRGGNLPIPATVEEARCRIEGGELKTVYEVSVNIAGEWPQLTGARSRREREPGDEDDRDIPAKAGSAGVADYSHDDIPF